MGSDSAAFVEKEEIKKGISRVEFVAWCFHYGYRKCVVGDYKMCVVGEAYFFFSEVCKIVKCCQF